MHDVAVILINVVAATVAIVVGMLSSRHLHIWADKAEPPRSPYRDAEPRVEVKAKTWTVRPFQKAPWVECPKCGASTFAMMAPLCRGKRWLGLWRRRCPSSDHFHRQCLNNGDVRGCGHRATEAPADNPEGGEWS